MSAKENINCKLREKRKKKEKKTGNEREGENKKEVSGYLYKLSAVCFHEGPCPLSSQSAPSLITGLALIEWRDVSRGGKHVGNLLTMCVARHVDREGSRGAASRLCLASPAPGGERAAGFGKHIDDDCCCDCADGDGNTRKAVSAQHKHQPSWLSPGLV